MKKPAILPRRLQKSMKYTTVGDIVNTAARLESYDKTLGKDSPWRVLIGDTTQGYLNRQFITKKIGEADLKGKNDRIKIYRVFEEAIQQPDN